MQHTYPKRFAIIGLPGSGKSTFALLLGQKLGIPVHHLDKHLFEKDGKKKDKEEFLSIYRLMLKEKSWIIEGCSFSTLETRFSTSTDVIYFQFSRFLCLWRILKRLFFYDKALTDTGCLMGINWSLVKYIWLFKTNKEKEIKALAKKYPEVRFHIFRNSKEAKQFLLNIG